MHAKGSTDRRTFTLCVRETIDRERENCAHIIHSLFGFEFAGKRRQTHKLVLWLTERREEKTRRACDSSEGSAGISVGFLCLLSALCCYVCVWCTRARLCSLRMCRMARVSRRKMSQWSDFFTWNLALRNCRRLWSSLIAYRVEFLWRKFLAHARLDYFKWSIPFARRLKRK